MKPVFLILMVVLAKLEISSTKQVSAQELTEAQIVNGKRFSLPNGFVIELVAKAPQVERPISCDFDELGRLYVTDSSGSNENVQEQLAKKPHRIVRLEDTNGDGVFNRSVVFAEQMMFPEGAMWHDGSLYVCAPPQIWKLTDTDGDGKADKREIWFDGKTLTGCANDLHGPYLGPDGWIYWCKGAFAKQSYLQADGSQFETRAAHIFRRRPSGGTVEPVMTGGMDNPVELVFTPEGELVFNSTFLHHPHDGKRDGLVHAIYGGVYGKDHGVLEGHPRTGNLMPVLADHDASAPSGLVRLESSHFGKSYQNNILCSSFNMGKIFRHRITTKGSMLQTRNEDFIVCHDLDFHPTDVIEDADGSVLIVDTGGWYKLCCPTSQLEKPDVLGAIYRVRRKGAVVPKDPRGIQVDWKSVDPATLLADARPAVRKRAHWQMAKQNLCSELQKIWKHEQPVDELTRLQAVWTLSKIDSDLARNTVRLALADPDPSVRQAAAHVVSVWRDKLAESKLLRLLKDEHAIIRRIAAEALGRIQSLNAIPALLEAAADMPFDPSKTRITDRGLEHSLIYALIEIGRADLTKAGIDSPNAATKHVALMALSQMDTGRLMPDQIIALLESESGLLRSTAWRIVQDHPEWASRLVNYFRHTFEKLELVPAQQLAPFLGNQKVQDVILAVLRREPSSANESKKLQRLKSHLVQVMGSNLPKNQNEQWKLFPQLLLQHQDEELLWATIQLLQNNRNAFQESDFDNQLRLVANGVNYSPRVRVAALANCKQLKLKPQELEFICGLLDVKHSIDLRLMAVQALEQASLNESEAKVVASFLHRTGPLELEKLLTRVSKVNSDLLGLEVVKSLARSPVASTIEIGRLSKLLRGFGKKTSRASEPLIQKLKAQTAAKSQQLDQVLSLVRKGDPRRGQAIFHSTKASCISCHQMGYLGGRIGPSLSRIGRIRSERDLLESLMYPNLSFVRSYEPHVIQTFDGRQFNGVIKNETLTKIELTIDSQKSVVIRKSEIENRRVGTQSIMPSGLDKQFSNQELADLIKFLKTAR